MAGRRSQGERDAVTVEIGFALVSGVFLAVVAGLVLASPILVLGLGEGAMRGAGVVAGTGAGVVLVWRVVAVLLRFERGRRRPG